MGSRNKINRDPGESEDNSLLRAIRFHQAERDRAYRDVKTGKVQGHIGFDGEVTVRVDALSSVTYRGGMVTYAW
jgi:hypothetical protein